jgi:hypothetical protein
MNTTLKLPEAAQLAAGEPAAAEAGAADAGAADAGAVDAAGADAAGAVVAPLEQAAKTRAATLAMPTNLLNRYNMISVPPLLYDQTAHPGAIEPAGGGRPERARSTA